MNAPAVKGSIDGWLLDVYEDPLGGAAVWFLGDDGVRRRLHQRFAVTFYAGGEAQLLGALEGALARRVFPNQPPARLAREQRFDVFARKLVDVLAVAIDRPADLAPFFRQVSAAFPGLTFWDADLQFSLRYAAQVGASPLCRCRVALGPGSEVISVTALEDPWQVDPSTMPLRVLTLRPDCDPAHAMPRALLVSTGGEPEFRLALRPARPLLVNLRALLSAYDPDLILTDWGDTWLLPLLLDLAEEHNLPLPLKRDPQAAIHWRKERWYFSYGQIVYRGQQVFLYGRWHIDRKNAMMWSDYELDGVLEMARVTCLPLQTAARVSPGTGISSIQMLAALKRQILVPWQKQQAEMPKPASDLYSADQGGLVFQPTPGVHRNVAAVDFVSMYPAIIVHFHISPETIGVSTPHSLRVPALNFVIDQGASGIVSMALAPLLNKRVTLKRRQSTLAKWDQRRASDKKRSSALKWLLVTCFGYLGYKNARFGRIEAHQAVTAFGREALLAAKDAAEEAGATVLHGYVDSLFVQWAGCPTRERLDALLADIEARTGLPIALDGVYKWVAFLPSKLDSNRPVPNRYFGIFEDGSIKARGIALRRRDTPAFIARVQGELVDILARAEDPYAALPEALAHLGRRLWELKHGRAPLEELLLAQRLTRDIDAYRSPSPAARAARQLQDAGKVTKPGQRVRFFYTLGDPGVHAWDLPIPPDPRSLDLSRYAELLLRAAREVLEPFQPVPEPPLLPLAGQKVIACPAEPDPAFYALEEGSFDAPGELALSPVQLRERVRVGSSL